MERGKLVATLYQGHMGGFSKKKNGIEVNPPKLEREEVSGLALAGRFVREKPTHPFQYSFRGTCDLRRWVPTFWHDLLLDRWLPMTRVHKLYRRSSGCKCRLLIGCGLALARRFVRVTAVHTGWV